MTNAPDHKTSFQLREGNTKGNIREGPTKPKPDVAPPPRKPKVKSVKISLMDLMMLYDTLTASLTIIDNQQLIFKYSEVDRWKLMKKMALILYDYELDLMEEK